MGLKQSNGIRWGTCGILAAGMLAISATPKEAQAAFSKFDDFDTYPAGQTLNGQGPAGNVWTTSATAGSSTNVVNVSGTNNAANPLNNSIPNWRVLPAGQTITNANTSSTVFWSFVQSVADNSPAGS